MEALFGLLKIPKLTPMVRFPNRTVAQKDTYIPLARFPNLASVFAKFLSLLFHLAISLKLC